MRAYGTSVTRVLQQFAPGFPSQKQIEEKTGAKRPLAPGEIFCGWVSFSPDDLPGNRSHVAGQSCDLFRAWTGRCLDAPHPYLLPQAGEGTALVRLWLLGKRASVRWVLVFRGGSPGVSQNRHWNDSQGL